MSEMENLNHAYTFTSDSDDAVNSKVVVYVIGQGSGHQEGLVRLLEEGMKEAGWSLEEENLLSTMYEGLHPIFLAMDLSDVQYVESDKSTQPVNELLSDRAVNVSIFNPLNLRTVPTLQPP